MGISVVRIEHVIRICMLVATDRLMAPGGEVLAPLGVPQQVMTIPEVACSTSALRPCCGWPACRPIWRYCARSTTVLEPAFARRASLAVIGANGAAQVDAAEVRLSG